MNPFGALSTPDQGDLHKGSFVVKVWMLSGAHSDGFDFVIVFHNKGYPNSEKHETAKCKVLHHKIHPETIDSRMHTYLATTMPNLLNKNEKKFPIIPLD
jgi:hypothetical protein